MHPLWPGMETGWIQAQPNAPNFGPRFQEFLQIEAVRHLIIFVGVLAILTPLIRWLATWSASKVVVRGENSSWVNAIKVWFIQLLLAGSYFVALIFTVAFGMSHPHAWQPVAIAGGITLLFFCLEFMVPMKVYEIGFFRALGLGVLSAVIGGVVSQVVIYTTALLMHVNDNIAALPVIVGTNRAENEAFVRRIAGFTAPDEIDHLLDQAFAAAESAQPLPQQEGIVRIIQQKLEGRRQTLAPADAPANVTYHWQLGRYLTLLKTVKAARDAQPQTASLH